MMRTPGTPDHSFVVFAIPALTSEDSLWNQFSVHSYVFPILYPLAQIALTGSVYSIVTITVERYLIVCHPFFTVQVRW